MQVVHAECLFDSRGLEVVLQCEFSIATHFVRFHSVSAINAENINLLANLVSWTNDFLYPVRRLKTLNFFKLILSKQLVNETHLNVAIVRQVHMTWMSTYPTMPLLVKQLIIYNRPIYNYRQHGRLNGDVQLSAQLFCMTGSLDHNLISNQPRVHKVCCSLIRRKKVQGSVEHGIINEAKKWLSIQIHIHSLKLNSETGTNTRQVILLHWLVEPTLVVCRDRQRA